MANKGSPTTATSGWLSNLLRPKGSGVTIESCLNLNNLNSNAPLDARPIIPLLEASHSLGSRARLIREFSVLCQRYSFTHLENVFFTVQDIMEPSAPKESRHIVFQFMAACIDSHYDSLGMARVTFYNALKDHHVYEDLKDMYIVFSKLIKDGRDITNFEKNIIKLLISWLNMAIAHSPVEKLGENKSSNGSYNTHPVPLAADTTKSEGAQAIVHDLSGKLAIPHVEQIIRLITAIMKFNFAMFEEKEVTELIFAIKETFWHSVDTNDQRACLEFADVIVPYGFVPIGGLQAYLDILCRAVAINDSYVSSQQLATLSMSIFKNLLRSHCAHSAVLTLCKSMNQTLAPGSTEELIAIGSLILLTHAAWSPENRGTNHNNVTSSTVLLSYIRRALKQSNPVINVQIFKSLLSYVQNQTISMTDWDIFWEICREYSETLLQVDDATGRDIITVVVNSAQLAYVGNTDESTTEPLLNASPSNVIQQYFILLHHVKHLYDQQDYKGPLDGFMDILHMLRSYLPEDMALILLAYYDKEHLFLPSSDGWLSLLEETSTTFFISPTSSRAVRLSMLDIIMNVCEATYDMYLNKLVLNVIIPIADMIRTSRDKQVIEKAVVLIVKVASDCTDHDAFRRLISALESCSKCKCLEHASSSSHGEKSSVQQSINERKRAVSQMARHPPKHYTQEKAPRPTASLSSSTASNSKSNFSTSSSSQASFCLGTASATGLAQIFQRLLHGSDPELCLIVYNCIISIAKNYADNMAVHDTSRLIALDVLLRLRCRPDHRIFLSTSVDATTQYSFAFGDRSLLGTDDDTAGTRAQAQNHMTSVQDTQPNRSYPAGQSQGNLREPDGLGIDHTINPRDDEELSWYTERPSRMLVSYSASENSEQSKWRVLPATELLHTLLEVITKDGNWNTVSFVLEALPAQLSNKHLFCGATQVLQQLRSTICEVITKHSFLENVKNMPPNLKRNDLNIMAYKILTIMISYRRIFSKQKQDEMVFCFYSGIMQITSSTRACINALTVCCHELPLSVSKMLNEILLKMSQIISVSSVSVHILEFLSGLARLPNLYANFTGDMYKPVFAIALNYIQYSRSLTSTHQSPTINSPTIQSPSTSQSSDSNNLVSTTNQPFQSAFAQYLLIMAYQVITVWFIAVPLRERRRHVPFIIKGLLSANSAAQTIDEQTLTCIDMLSRFSFANVDLAPKKSIVSNILMTATSPSNSSTHDTVLSGKQISRTWVQGNTLFTLKCAATTGWVEATIRRPSGTVSLMCKVENEIRGNDIDDLTLPAFLMMHYNPDPGLGLLDTERASMDPPGSATATNADDILEPSTHEKDLSVQKTGEASQSIGPSRDFLTNTVRDILTSSTSTQNNGQALSHLRKDEHSFDPSFLYLQFGNYPDLAGLRDIIPPVPDDETHQRALSMLDRVAVVNFHKIGVIYVGPGQTHEIDILANQHGSPDYVIFLNGLGTIRQLKGRTGNTGGLDREMDIDGKYAYFWYDDTTEVVFHAATLMPTDLTRDPQCSGKKRHIGNDFVTIVYNDSGKDYAFDTLPGQFNFINIVVSPHSEDSSKVILGSSQDQRVSTSAAATAFAAGQHPDPYTTSTGMDNTFFKVVMQRRPNMSEIGPLTEFKMVSSQTLPGFIRQMALHANIFSQVFLESGAGGKHEYVSNWCERLRQINRIKERLSASKNDMATAKSSKEGIMALEPMLDFTRYT